MSEALDWVAIGQETVEHLRALLCLDTTNPPGKEIIAVEYLADALSGAGIEPLILESEPGRANLVARLKGDDSLPPLLLMSHVDVVTAEPAHWTYPPFAAELRDGYVWGRGAVDMKNMVALELGVMLLLARYRVPLQRDVIFMAAADEERGGFLGAGWLVDHHPETIRAEYAINEGGGFGLRIGSRTYYPIQTGEKGTSRFTLRARGRPGHASEPHADNAVVKLARAVARLGEMGGRLPPRITPTAAAFLRTVAQGQEPALREALTRLVDEPGADLDGLGLEPDTQRMITAMIRNTATPTILQAGQKINVIPSQAEAQVDGRILPGESQESFRLQLEAVLHDPELEIEFGVLTPPLEALMDTPLYHTIARALERHDPEGIPVPFLLNGATDAKHVQRLGTLVYGFCPMRHEDHGVLHLAHAHDERVSVANMHWGLRVLFDVVLGVAAPALTAVAEEGRKTA